MLAFQLHLPELLVIVAAGVAHYVFVKSGRARVRAWCALGALAAVTMWPLGDLAASVSLTAATVQRLVIMLFVAPMLLRSTPTSVLATLTRARLADYVMRVVAHPAVAIALVTVVGTMTLAVPVVDLGARSSIMRDVTLIVVLLVGFVLWIPALALMPGVRRLSPIARAAYIFVAALVVTSMSFVWIFARHPLYPGLHHQEALLHMTPLFDQQLAGFVSKLGCYAPMWAIAFTIFARADERGVDLEESPLHWADVERALLRVDRQRERERRRARFDR